MPPQTTVSRPARRLASSSSTPCGSTTPPTSSPATADGSSTDVAGTPSCTSASATASAFSRHGDQTPTVSSPDMGPSCPLPSRLRVDLVHTSPVVSTSLRRELQRGHHPVEVTTTVHSWTDFQEEWDFAGDFVVLDALLDDHVPLPLKIRALRRLGSLTIVLGPGRDTPFAARCAAEGALAWIEPALGLVETTDAIRSTVLGHVPEYARLPTASPPVADLTDRELQVCCLYAALRGHSPQHLGRMLGLRTETIRSHLERGRARYRAAGCPTQNRAALREALVADGWLLDPQVWVDAGRP